MRMSCSSLLLCKPLGKKPDSTRSYCPHLHMRFSSSGFLIVAKTSGRGFLGLFAIVAHMHRLVVFFFP